MAAYTEQWLQEDMPSCQFHMKQYTNAALYSIMHLQYLEISLYLKYSDGFTHKFIIG